jgi:hypothetical protein
MTTMGHSPPPGGAIANGHQLVPLAPAALQKLGPVSALPQQDDPGQSRTSPDNPGRRYPWPLMVIAAPAAVAVWSGWVGLGAMCGFGVVDLLPGIADLRINTAITLPVGIESYGAYALASWISGKGSARTRTFAFRSAIGALALGCLGQVAFHLLAAAGWTVAPWPVVMAVACLPVVTLSFAAALVHLKRADALGGTADDSGEPEGDTDGGEGDKPPPAWHSMPPGGDKAAAIIKASPGLTNAEVADLAGCDRRTVQRARNGKP